MDTADLVHRNRQKLDQQAQGSLALSAPARFYCRQLRVVELGGVGAGRHAQFKLEGVEAVSRPASFLDKFYM